MSKIKNTRLSRLDSNSQEQSTFHLIPYQEDGVNSLPLPKVHDIPLITLFNRTGAASLSIDWVPLRGLYHRRPYIPIGYSGDTAAKRFVNFGERDFDPVSNPHPNRSKSLRYTHEGFCASVQYTVASAKDFFPTTLIQVIEQLHYYNTRAHNLNYWQIEIIVCTTIVEDAPLSRVRCWRRQGEKLNSS